MADIFQLGEEASKKKFVAKLQELWDAGEGVLDAIEAARLASLVEFDRRLSAMNSRRQRAHRVQAPQVAVQFPVSDFLDLDQTLTTGTTRADSKAVTLRERSTPAEAVIKSKKFTTSKGTAETLDANELIIRVHTDDGSRPTGQFDLELVTPLVLNLLVFDIVASPSEPTIVVSVSPDGVTYSAAREVSRNGYRVNAWLPPLEVRFIRIAITPSHPDTLGGTTFSFGLTSFSSSSTQFHLRSELVSRVVTFSPRTTQLTFRADADSNLTYFLSLAGGPFIECAPDSVVSVPGTATVVPVEVGIDTNGLLAHTLPGTQYLSTLVVTEQRLLNGVQQDVEMPIAVGLLRTDTNVSSLVNEYIGVDAPNLHLIQDQDPIDTGRTFKVSYVTGPSTMTAQLKVRLSTSDRSITPVFHGALLEEV